MEGEPGAGNSSSSSLQDVSEKQFTIYISTARGQFSVSHAAISTLITDKSEFGLSYLYHFCLSDTKWLFDFGAGE